MNTVCACLNKNAVASEAINLSTVVARQKQYNIANI